MVGAIRLRAATFEEVEHDRTATAQAALVVAIAGLASGLANAGLIGIGGAVSLVVIRLVGWVIGSFVLLMVGTRLLPGRNTEADIGQVLRTAGFAQSAGVLGVLGIIPILGGLIELIVGLWILVALVVAVRQALDYDETARAIVVCLVAWTLMFLVSFVAGLAGFGASMHAPLR
jgi:hypothetical protein